MGQPAVVLGTPSPARSAQARRRFLFSHWQLPNRLTNPKPVAVRIRIDFDHYLLDGSAWRLTATDRSHCNKASCLELCERAREIRLSPPSHVHQFDNRLRFAVANKCEQLSIVRRQQPDHSRHRIKAWPGRISRGRSFAACDCLHLRSQGIQALNFNAGHFRLRISSTLRSSGSVGAQGVYHRSGGEPVRGGICVSTISIVGCLTENLPDCGHGPSQIGTTVPSQTQRPTAAEFVPTRAPSLRTLLTVLTVFRELLRIR